MSVTLPFFVCFIVLVVVVIFMISVIKKVLAYNQQILYRKRKNIHQQFLKAL